ncbi:MAG TPA: PIN domain-containing protein [Candidatus Sulfotelmatobacter sp.]|jgi:predicted nucleic acid-binding protein|nr:PIN domain-containing protein [Candidatus Sulfotelmatobacter sp.]
MKTYWDSSALVESVWEPGLQARLRQERGVTRPHALAEVFSALTGNPQNRVATEIAADLVEQLAENLDFVDLTAAEMLAALKSARKLGVRGGRVHDFFHAVAAKKSGAKKIVTLDQNDFAGLTDINLEVI